MRTSHQGAARWVHGGRALAQSAAFVIVVLAGCMGPPLPSGGPPAGSLSETQVLDRLVGTGSLRIGPEVELVGGHWQLANVTGSLSRPLRLLGATLDLVDVHLELNSIAELGDGSGVTIRNSTIQTSWVMVKNVRAFDSTIDGNGGSFSAFAPVGSGVIQEYRAVRFRNFGLWHGVIGATTDDVSIEGTQATDGRQLGMVRLHLAEPVDLARIRFQAAGVVVAIEFPSGAGPQPAEWDLNLRGKAGEVRIYESKPHRTHLRSLEHIEGLRGAAPPVFVDAWIQVDEQVDSVLLDLCTDRFSTCAQPMGSVLMSPSCDGQASIPRRSVGAGNWSTLRFVGFEPGSLVINLSAHLDAPHQVLWGGATFTGSTFVIPVLRAICLASGPEAVSSYSYRIDTPTGYACGVFLPDTPEIAVILQQYTNSPADYLVCR